MTLPLVALVLLAILAVARVGTERVLVQIAAREGARRAVVGSGAGAAADAARSVFADGVADVDVRESAGADAGPDTGGPGSGGAVTVTVVRRIHPAVPVIAQLLPETIELHGTVSMRTER